MSASPDRYQSRVLNFLSQQFRRFGERHDRAVRHLKVATAWSAQILLYPIYALFQTARRATQQLQPDAAQEKPQLGESIAYPETANADTPIARVLEAVKSLSLSDIFVKQISPPERGAIARKESPNPPIQANLPEAIARKESPNPPIQASLPEAIARKKSPNPPIQANLQQTTLTQPPGKIIQGVASLLATKTPVLVSDRNEILDILTPPQQQQLRQRIIEEVADYWNYSRNKTSRSPLEVTANILPPMRLFFTAMVWMQTTPLAIAINLFQEAALVWQPREEESRKHLSHASNPPIPAKLPIKTALTQSSQELLNRVQKLGVDLVSEPMTPETLQSDKLGVQALIRAAVDFFFGVNGETLPAPIDTEISQSGIQPGTHLSLNQLVALRTREKPVLNLSDPWLAPQDLFSSDTPSNLKNRPQIVGLTLPASPHANATIANSLNSAKAIAPKTDKIAQPKNTQSLTLTQADQKVKQKKSSAATTQKAPERDNPIQIPATATETLSHAPDWIETQAYSVGYVKHPLEMLLEWVDRALLWCEKILIEIWHWVQKFKA